MMNSGNISLKHIKKSYFHCWEELEYVGVCQGKNKIIILIIRNVQGANNIAKEEGSWVRMKSFSTYPIEKDNLLPNGI